MITGNEMKLIRSIKNIKQAGLANKLGKSQQYLSKLENLNDKELPAYWSKKIIVALDCNEKDLQKIKAMLSSEK